MLNLGLRLEAGGLLTTSQMVCMPWGNDGEHRPYTAPRAHQEPQEHHPGGGGGCPGGDSRSGVGGLPQEAACELGLDDCHPHLRWSHLKDHGQGPQGEHGSLGSRT